VRTISELIRAAVDDAGDKAWLLTHDGELTYAQMLARVERAASALRATGVQRGDRVLTTPRNTADYLLSWFALMPRLPSAATRSAFRAANWLW